MNAKQPRNWRTVSFFSLFVASLGLVTAVAWGDDDAQKRNQRNRQSAQGQGPSFGGRQPSQGQQQQSQQRFNPPQQQSQQRFNPAQQQLQRSNQAQQPRFNPQQQQQVQQFQRPQNTGSASGQGNSQVPNPQRFQGGRATAGGAGGNTASGQPFLQQQPGATRDRGQANQNNSKPGNSGNANANSGQPTFRPGTGRGPLTGQNQLGGNPNANPSGQNPNLGNGNAGNTVRSRTPGGNNAPPYFNPDRNKAQTGSNNSGITGNTIPGANIPPRRPTASNNTGGSNPSTGPGGQGGTFDRGKTEGGPTNNSNANNNVPGSNRVNPGSRDLPGRFGRPGDLTKDQGKGTGGNSGTPTFPRRPTAGDDLKLGGNKNNPSDNSNANNSPGGRGPRPGKTGDNNPTQLGDANSKKGPLIGTPGSNGDKNGNRDRNGRDRSPGADKIGNDKTGADKIGGNRPGRDRVGGSDKDGPSGRPHRDPTLPPRGSGFQVDASKLSKDNKRGPGRDTITNKDLQKVAWKNRVDDQRLQQLTRHAHSDKIKLGQQYQLHDRGDVGRRMGLHNQLVAHGGWDHRHMGWVNAGYHNHCFERPYWGPSWYPSYCWYPRWSTWVSWSWGYNCLPVWDPRPIYCRPIVYEPCVRWVYYDYPVWQPLPVATCGTWVDVEPVVVDQGNDLELLAVRFVDPGYPEQNKGPRYRAWLRNNGKDPITQPFNVLAMGTPTDEVTEDRLETGQRIPSIDPGQIVAVDLRFPLSAADDLDNLPELNKLHILVDSHREIQEANEANNGVVLDRGEIMSVDPVAFGVDAEVAETGGTINLAGEGLGPEPGQVLLQMDGEQQEIEVLGWYDLGVQVQLPDVQMGDMSKAELVVVRGDGAATNPLPIQIVQAGTAEQY